MNGRWSTLIFVFASQFLLFSGCANDTQVERLNVKEIAKQELIADQARQQFWRGQYDGIPSLLKPLCQERTTSQPLYQCELGVCHLARNDKQNAYEYLLDAYTSIEGFFDPASETRAMSLWGAEAEKVYKGEPYEQATLSLLAGLLLLEEGDVDNALSCFKNGQLADSGVKNEQFQCDYGLLQLLEAKCYQMRHDQAEYDQLVNKGIDSFGATHPRVRSIQAEIVAENLESDASAAEKMEMLDTRLLRAREKVIHGYRSYFGQLMQSYNVLLLVWTGRSPEMRRTGQYGEERVFVKCPSRETHYELQLDNSSWHDVLRGFADVSYQATTRGGREMDNVLANQAEFKSTAHAVGDTFIDAADDVSDPYAALVLLGAGLISHGFGAATQVQADIRCWKTLPDEIAVVPLELAPGTHHAKIDCYDENFRLRRSANYQFVADGRPFQFFNFVVPAVISSESNEK
ncbi:MAG: hypothetical protein ACYTBJ_17830 [Planctomycetota bacterium]|jgi:hypothetical protein